MYRLMYVSTASSEITEDGVNSLVEAACQKNERLGITGVLAYNGMNFAQILEGDRDRIASLMNEIRTDNRHSGVIVTAEKAVGKRAYPNFGMRRVDGLNFDNEIRVMQDE